MKKLRSYRLGEIMFDSIANISKLHKIKNRSNSNSSDLLEEGNA